MAREKYKITTDNYRDRFSKEQIETGIVVYHSPLRMSLCHTAQETIRAIKELTGKECDQSDEENIEKLFKGEQLRGMTSYGCFIIRSSYAPHRIALCPALGPTIEEHQKKYKELNPQKNKTSK